MLISRLGSVAKSGHKATQVTHAAEVGGLVFGGTVETSIEATHAAQVGGLVFGATASPIIEVAMGGEVRGLTFAAEYDGRNLVQHGGVVDGLTFAANIDPIVDVSHAANVGGLVFGASVDNATWTPAKITTALWLKEDGTVSSWTDHSGNNRHATQAIATNQPSISNTLNGLTVRTFDGINDFMRSSASLTTGTYANDFIIFLVQKRNGANNGGTWFTERSSTRIGIFSVQLAGGFYYISSDGVNGSSNHQIGVSDYNATANWSIINRQARSGLRDVFYIDGTARTVLTGTSTSITGGTSYYTIGARQNNTDFMQGDLAEVIVLTTPPNTDTRQRIEGYLAHKWGLTANLPADHPYKTNPPLI